MEAKTTNAASDLEAAAQGNGNNDEAKTSATVVATIASRDASLKVKTATEATKMEVEAPTVAANQDVLLLICRQRSSLPAAKV